MNALADSVRHYRNTHGDADKLLMSFNGIPQEYASEIFLEAGGENYEYFLV
jgi:ferrochelatase